MKVREAMGMDLCIWRDMQKWIQSRVGVVGAIREAKLVGGVYLVKQDTK